MRLLGFIAVLLMPGLQESLASKCVKHDDQYTVNGYRVSISTNWTVPSNRLNLYRNGKAEYVSMTPGYENECDGNIHAEIYLNEPGRHFAMGLVHAEIWFWPNGMPKKIVKVNYAVPNNCDMSFAKSNQLEAPDRIWVNHVEFSENGSISFYKRCPGPPIHGQRR